MVKFNPRYFILFDATVNRVVFLISPSDSSLSVYTNAADFCVYWFYILHTSLVFSNSFLVGSLEFSVYIMLRVSFSFLIWIPFLIPLIYLFSCLIALTSSSNTMLNKNGKRGYSCLVLILEEKLLAFYCWIWCKLCTCHIWPLLCWGTFSLYPTLLRVFITNGYWILLNAFSASIEMIRGRLIHVMKG